MDAKSQEQGGSSRKYSQAFKTWFFGLLEKSMQNCPRNPFISYLCYFYFYLQILSMLSNISFPLNTVTSAANTILKTVAVEIHEAHSMAFHIGVGIYMAIAILSLVCLHLPQNIFHRLSYAALRIWSFIFYINPWVLLQLSSYSFLLGLTCTEESNFLGNVNSDCRSAGNILFFVYSVCGLVFNFLIAVFSLIGPSAVITKKCLLFTYSHVEHTLLIVYFFVIQMIIAFTDVDKSHGLLIGILMLLGLAFFCFLFYRTMNFTNLYVMRLKALGYGLTLAVCLIETLSQNSDIQRFFESGATSKTFVAVTIFAAFFARFITGMIEKRLNFILGAGPKELTSPYDVLHQYMAFSRFLKIGIKVHNTDKLPLTQEEMKIKGIINHHTTNCKDAECFCKARSFLFDALIRQHGDESNEEIYDKVFLKYFLKHILETGHNKFSNSWMLTLVFVRCCFKKLGHVNRAYTLLTDLQRQGQSTFLDRFYARFFNDQIRARLRQVKQNSSYRLVQLDSKFKDFEAFFKEFVDKMKATTDLSLIFVTNLDRQELLMVTLQELGLAINKHHARIEKMWEYYIAEYSKDFHRPYLLYSLFLLHVANQPYKAMKLLQAYQVKYMDNFKGLGKYANFDTFDKQNENLFISASSSKRKLGDIIYTSANAEAFTGYDKNFLLNSRINVLMSKYFDGYHDKFLLSHIDKGTERILHRTRELFMRHRTGVLMPISIMVTNYMDPQHGLAFLAVINRRNVPHEYIFTTYDGKVDSFTEGIGGLFRLDKYLKSGDKTRELHFQALCKEFEMLNRARNVDILFEKKWKLLGGIESLSDAKCRSMFEADGEVAADARGEINDYLRLSRDIANGFILRVYPVSATAESHSRDCSADINGAPYVLECQFEEEFFLSNTTLIRTLVIRQISQEDQVIFGTSARRSGSIFDPLENRERKSSHSGTVTNSLSIPEDTSDGRRMKSALRRLESNGLPRHISSVNNSIHSEKFEHSKTGNLFHNLGDVLKESKGVNFEIPDMKSVDQSEKGGDQMYQTIGNFSNIGEEPAGNVLDSLQFRNSPARRVQTGPNQLSQGSNSSEKSRQSNDGWNSPQTSMRKHLTLALGNAKELQENLREVEKNPERRLLNRSKGISGGIMEKDQGTSGNEQEFTNKALASRTSQLVSKNGGRPIHNVLKLMINQKFNDKTKFDAGTSLGSTTTSNGLRSLAKQIETMLQSTMRVTIIRHFKIYTVAFFISLVALWMVGQVFYSRTIPMMNDDLEGINLVYERLESMVDICRLSTYLLLTAETVFSIDRHKSDLGADDFEIYCLDQISTVEQELRTYNRDFRVLLAGVKPEIAHEVYNFNITLQLFDSDVNSQIPTTGLAIVDFIAGLGFEISKLSPSEITTDNPILKAIIENSLDDLVIRLEEDSTLFHEQIAHELDNIQSVLTIVTAISFLIYFFSLLFFAYVSRRLYNSNTAFFRTFTFLTNNEIFWMENDLKIFNKAIALSYSDESELIDFSSKMRGVEVLAYHRMSEKKDLQNGKQNGGRAFKTASARNFNRRGWVKYLPFALILAILTALYASILSRSASFESDYKALILNEYSQAQQRLHSQSLSMIGLYLMIAYNGELNLRNNPISEELVTIMNELLDFSTFIKLYTASDHTSSEIDELINHDFCPKADANFTSVSDCETIADGAVKRGLSGMDSFMQGVHQNIINDWVKSGGNMTIDQRRALLAEQSVIDSEAMYYHYLYPAYVKMIQHIQENVVNESAKEEEILTVISVFFYLLVVVGIAILLFTLDQMSNQSLRTRKILRMIPCQVILTNMSIKKYLKRTFPELKLII